MAAEPLVFVAPEIVLSQLPGISFGGKSPRCHLSHLHIGRTVVRVAIDQPVVKVTISQCLAQ